MTTPEKVLIKIFQNIKTSETVICLVHDSTVIQVLEYIGFKPNIDYIINGKIFEWKVIFTESGKKYLQNIEESIMQEVMKKVQGQFTPLEDIQIETQKKKEEFIKTLITLEGK
jgi:hypothetical protein